jgi:two-component system sensor histidine kinase CreC
VRIQLRLLSGFAIVLACCFYFLIFWTTSDVNTQPKKAMEESMVDMANLVASYLELKIKKSDILIDELKTILNKTKKREFLARIYELKKKNINFRVFVIDKKGIVIFDSKNNNEIGKDYSRWNDIQKTFKGKYGARTSRENPDDPDSSAAYVSAPIYSDKKIIGVCTIVKSWSSIHTFIRTTQKNFILTAIIGFVIIFFLSYFISLWITHPIKKLTNYANSIKNGEQPDFPCLGRGEIKTLGDSFEKMKDSLEGKKYIEKYIQNLTHQLKGPISSIKGAAELLQENLPEEDRIKFILNIENENSRIQRIVDQLLKLVIIERKKELQNIEEIDLKDIIEEIIESVSPVISQKKIICKNKIEESCYFYGEKFLILQAISNLIQNALEFTPENGSITILSEKLNHKIILKIIDNGPGIPDYALSKVFNKFYSLPRSDSNQKSSGLGLSFVKEIAKLHCGDAQIFNNKTQGVTSIITINSDINNKQVPFSGF